MLDSPSMDLEFLMVPDAPPPPPTAPYSHAVRAGEFLFVTGQMFLLVEFRCFISAIYFNFRR